MTAMRPWKEHWYANNAGAIRTVDAWIATFGRSVYDLDAPYRARLAAGAPDMARLLLEHEWSATWVGYSPMLASFAVMGPDEQANNAYAIRQCCPACGGAKPGSYWIPAEKQNHRSDCAWVAALRKAGVR